MSEVLLTRALVLESPVRVSDGAGGFTLTWVAQGQVWGEVKPGAGSDPAAIEVSLATVPYRITVRGAPVGSPARPKPEQRFRDGSRIYHILAVTERDADAIYLTCFAKEEVPE